MGDHAAGRGWLARDWESSCRRRGGVGSALLLGLIDRWRVFRAGPCRWCVRTAPYFAGALVGWFHEAVLRFLNL